MRAFPANSSRLSLALVLLALLFACTRVPTPTPTPQPIPTLTPTPFLNANIPVVKPPFTLLRRDPAPGVPLGLHAALTFTFTRPLDTKSVPVAFRLTTAAGEVIPGTFTFPTEQAFRFVPDQPLTPETRYTVTLSTDLRAADGTALGAPLSFTYDTEAAFAVQRVFPPKGSQAVPLDAEITVVFNKPVAPLTSREAAPPLPLEITPAVEGQGAWVSSTIYVFRPDHPLCSDATYTVRLPASVTSLSGETLTEPLVWRFTTRAVKVTDLRVDDQWADANNNPALYVRRDAAVRITFSDPMDEDSVAQALSITAADGSPAPPYTLRWNERATKLTIVPQGLYAPDTRYIVTLSTEAQARDGGHLVAPASTVFQTAGRPAVVRLPRQQDYFSPWISLEFNTYPDRDTLEGHIQISPAPERLTWEVHDRTLTLGQLAAGTTYTIALLPGIADLYGEVLDQPITFQITTAHLDPGFDLLLPSGGVALLRADGPQSLWVRHANLTSLRLDIYAVADATLLHGLTTYDTCPTSPNLVFSQTLDLSQTQRDRTHYLDLALPDLLGHPLPPGAYCLRVDGQPNPWGQTQGAWLLVATDHLTLKTFPQGGLVWVTDLDTAASQADQPLTLYAVEETEDRATRVVPLTQGVSDAQGLFQQKDLTKTPRFALLHTPDRFAIADAQWEADSPSGYHASYWWVQDEQARRTQAFLYTDRPLYRPGQTIYFKGLVRVNEDLHYHLPETTQVWVRLDRQGTEVARQTLDLSSWGTFAGSFSLLQEAPVGAYTLTVHAGPVYLGSFTVRVAAYHKPVFEVALTPQQPDLIPGQTTTVRLQTTYYAGDVVANAQVTWHTEVQSYFYRPPVDFRDYTFTQEVYWPWEWAFTGPEYGPGGQTQKGVTDAQGRLDIPLDPAAALRELKDQDVQITLWATVTDAGGNTADGHTTVVVRRSQVYVGLKTDRWVGVQGEPLQVHLVALSPKGEPLAGQRITVEVLREEWHSVQRRGADGILRWESSLETTPVTTLGPVTTDGRGQADITFTPEQSGTYRLVARTTDAQGRPRQAALRVWVAGEEALLWEQSTHLLPVVPDQPAYRPGDTARLLVPQPYAESTYALVTLERGQVYQARVVRLEQASNLIELPIEADLAPQVFASVLTLRPARAGQPPDYRMGTVRLPVALDAQTLRVEVTPDREQAGPGETLHLTLRTTTLDGQPVSAEVSVAVVDKALLALAPDTYDLLGELYPANGLQVATALGTTQDLEAYNARIQRLLPTGEGMGSGGGGKGMDTGGVITVRETFRDTAYWQAQVRTDAQGRAEVSFTLPDNMTTWVVRARAVTADTRAGEGVAEVRVSRPFFVRLHTPAFFTAGDEVALQAVVHNTTDAPLEATVRLSRAEGVTLADPVTQQVTVPAGGQGAVSWQAKIAADARRVDLLVEARADGYTDAARPTLTLLPDGGIPVYRFHTVEAVGTAGALTQAAQVVEGVSVPSDAANATLHLQLSGSLLARLRETLVTLGQGTQPTSRCTLSYASPLLANAALLQALDASGAPPAEALRKAAHQMTQALIAFQAYDGGWPWCPQGESRTEPTLWATWAMLEARRAGLGVEPRVLDHAADFLETALEKEMRQRLQAPEGDLLALTLDLLTQLGRRPAGAAYRLNETATARRGALSLAGWALLLHAAQEMGMKPAFTDPIVQRLENGAVVSSAVGAHWDGAGWWGWASDAGTTALALRALLQADPQAPFLPQTVLWLLGVRGERGWGSDTTNALVALALARWAAFSGEAQPDYDYAAYLDETLLAQAHMTPAEASNPQTWTWTLRPDSTHSLRLGRGAGPGVLYYQAFLDLTLPAAGVPPLSNGLQVERAYYALEDLTAPRTVFHPGQLIQVRLTLTMPHDLHQVVLTDYLPAGLEALDLPTEPYPADLFSAQDYLRYGWGNWYFYHRETYDERVVMVAPTLPAGVYTLTYYARATVPGRFQVRPTVAYETAFPDVRGRSAGAMIEVRR